MAILHVLCACVATVRNFATPISLDFAYAQAETAAAATAAEYAAEIADLRAELGTMGDLRLEVTGARQEEANAQAAAEVGRCVGKARTDDGGSVITHQGQRSVPRARNTRCPL